MPASFADCGGQGPFHTFESARGGTPRIDYIAIDARIDVVHCAAQTVLDIELLAKRVDHLPIMLKFAALPPSVAHGKVACKRIAACCQSSLVSDPARVAAFVAELGALEPLPAGSVTCMLGQVTAVLQNAACRHFARERGLNRKPWISEGTWAIISKRRRCINRLLGARGARRRWILRSGFLAMRGLALEARRLILKASHVPTQAVVLAVFVRYSQGTVKRMLAADRESHVCDVVAQAADADLCGDSKGLFGCFRKFAAFQPRPLPMLQQKDGSLVADSGQRAELMLEHFAGLMRGQAVQAEVVQASPLRWRPRRCPPWKRWHIDWRNSSPRLTGQTVFLQRSWLVPPSRLRGSCTRW